MAGALIRETVFNHISTHQEESSGVHAAYSGVLLTSYEVL